MSLGSTLTCLKGLLGRPVSRAIHRICCYAGALHTGACRRRQCPSLPPRRDDGVGKLGDIGDSPNSPNASAEEDNRASACACILQQGRRPSLGRSVPLPLLTLGSTFCLFRQLGIGPGLECCPGPQASRRGACQQQCRCGPPAWFVEICETIPAFRRRQKDDRASGRQNWR